jgi:5'-nucleotidase
MRESTGADAALVNAGSIRDSIGPGEVSLADVMTALPFANRVVLVTVTGAELAAALVHGRQPVTLQKGYGTGAYLQTDGIEVDTADGTPMKILVAGQPLDPGATYRVAVNDFLADGGDGYGPWLGRGPAERQETWLSVVDLVAEEIRRR